VVVIADGKRQRQAGHPTFLLIRLLFSFSIVGRITAA
jgi:hypothetical protein